MHYRLYLVFIDNFYHKRYDNVKIIKNVECRHYQACNTTDCKDVGRFVKFSYVKNDGSKDVESIFFKYNNEVEKNVISNRYNKLVNEHIGYVNRNWLIILIVFFGFWKRSCMSSIMHLQYECQI